MGNKHYSQCPEMFPFCSQPNIYCHVFDLNACQNENIKEGLNSLISVCTACLGISVR